MKKYLLLGTVSVLGTQVALGHVHKESINLINFIKHEDYQKAPSSSYINSKMVEKPLILQMDEFVDINTSEKVETRQITQDIEDDFEDVLNSPEAVELFFPPTPFKEEAKLEQKTSWLEYGFRGITNLLQTPLGKQTKPAELRVDLQKTLDLQNQSKWQASKSTYNGAEANQSIYYVRQDEQKKVIVTSPVHDLEERLRETSDYNRSANLSIEKALRAIVEENPSGKLEVCMPVAQANTHMMGTLKRNHWTTLKIDINDGTVNNANMYDSKGYLSSLYQGNSIIKDRIASVTNSSTPVTAHYLGHQGLVNNNDCGRFATSYIQQISLGTSPNELTTEQVKSTTGFKARVDIDPPQSLITKASGFISNLWKW